MAWDLRFRNFSFGSLAGALRWDPRLGTFGLKSLALGPLVWGLCFEDLRLREHQLGRLGEASKDLASQLSKNMRGGGAAIVTSITFLQRNPITLTSNLAILIFRPDCIDEMDHRLYQTMRDNLASPINYSVWDPKLTPMFACAHKPL